MKKLVGKRGNILTENIVAILLNLIFLVIMIFFLISRMGNTADLEEGYAKQIALMLDVAKPGMIVSLNMEDGFNKAKKNGLDFKEIVIINDNFVTVRLSKKSSYSYSFFNNLDIVNYYSVGDDYNFFIGGYK